MNEVLEEFKIVFGFDDKPLQDGIKKTENSLAGLGKVFGSIMASFVSFQALKAITVDYVNFNIELGKSTSLLGLNVEEVSALGGALERFGGNTDSAITSIKSLSGHLEQAKRGQGALIEVSRKYGLRVNPFASATDTLKSLGSQMGRFTHQQRLAISQQLGLDESLTRAFADGGKELDKYIQKQKELGTTTQEDIDLSNKFSNAQLDLKDIFGALTRDFARVILPSFTKLIELFSSFIEWVRKHKQLVVIFFAAVLIAMTPILIMLGKMAIASLIAFAPMLKAVAVIAGISLIAEDIYGYFMGWDSVTGDLVKKFPVIGTVLEYIRPIVIGIADTFGAIVDWLKDPTFENFGKIFDNVLNIVKEIVIAISVGIYDAIGAIGMAIVELGKTILEWFTKPIDGAVESLKGMFNSAKNFLGFGSDKDEIPIPESPEEKEVKEKLANSNKDIKENMPKESVNEKEVKEKIIENNKDTKETISKVESPEEKSVKEKIIENNKDIKETISKESKSEKEVKEKIIENSNVAKKENINITVKNEKSIPDAPPVPYQSSTMNNQNNNYNVNNNFNQNISTATPTQFANQTNAQIADSIYNIRQQNGAL